MLATSARPCSTRACLSGCSAWLRLARPTHRLPPLTSVERQSSWLFRTASSASSSRWRTRQNNDSFAREARVAGLKSRAAFKLLQINDKYHIFRRGITVVDLGYAPGSWSQVAVNRCTPGCRVIGVDIIPAQPPRGVSTIQGDFLSPAIQEEVRSYVSDPDRGRPKPRQSFSEEMQSLSIQDDAPNEAVPAGDDRGYIDMERHMADESATRPEELGSPPRLENHSDGAGEAPVNPPDTPTRTVDVVLSDMSTPWEPITGHGKNSLIDPYRRLMRTSGMPFRDHAGSMDLCTAALEFAYDTLKDGGHFVCKFYQGSEDKLLETRVRRLFDKVHREKPAASRNDSKEGYFVALRRKSAPTKAEIFAD